MVQFSSNTTVRCSAAGSTIGKKILGDFMKTGLFVFFLIGVGFAADNITIDYDSMVIKEDSLFYYNMKVVFTPDSDLKTLVDSTNLIIDDYTYFLNVVTTGKPRNDTQGFKGQFLGGIRIAPSFIDCPKGSDCYKKMMPQYPAPAIFDTISGPTTFSGEAEYIDIELTCIFTYSFTKGVKKEVIKQLAPIRIYNPKP